MILAIILGSILGVVLGCLTVSGFRRAGKWLNNPRNYGHPPLMPIAMGLAAGPIALLAMHISSGNTKAVVSNLCVLIAGFAVAAAEVLRARAWNRWLDSPEFGEIIRARLKAEGKL